MNEILALLAQYGVLLVFVCALLEQLGAPIPAIPILIVAGALAAGGHLSVLQAFAAAMVGAVFADVVWYAAGRRYGHRVLRLLCRLSLSPDSCVRQTERFFIRWGVGSLVVAKFVPGLSTVAPPLAGAMGLRPGAFMVFNSLGAAVWAGSALLLGWLLADQIDSLIEFLARMGGYALSALAALLALYMVVKWWERHRFLEQLRAARIGVEDLYGMIKRGETPLVLDVRSEAALGLDRRRIPGALMVDPDAPDTHLVELPRDQEIIIYCS